jgi:hypothetical protein
MAVRLARSSGTLVDAAEIEVRVVQSGVQSKCVAVGPHGLVLSIEVLEKKGQVER